MNWNPGGREEGVGVGGGWRQLQMGVRTYYWANFFPENYMKMKILDLEGEDVPDAPSLGSTNAFRCRLISDFKALISKLLSRCLGRSSPSQQNHIRVK